MITNRIIKIFGVLVSVITQKCCPMQKIRSQSLEHNGMTLELGSTTPGPDLTFKRQVKGQAIILKGRNVLFKWLKVVLMAVDNLTTSTCIYYDM